MMEAKRYADYLRGSGREEEQHEEIAFSVPNRNVGRLFILLNIAQQVSFLPLRTLKLREVK